MGTSNNADEVSSMSEFAQVGHTALAAVCTQRPTSSATRNRRTTPSAVITAAQQTQMETPHHGCTLRGCMLVLRVIGGLWAADTAASAAVCTAANFDCHAHAAAHVCVQDVEPTRLRGTTATQHAAQAHWSNKQNSHLTSHDCKVACCKSAFGPHCQTSTLITLDAQGAIGDAEASVQIKVALICIELLHKVVC